MAACSLTAMLLVTGWGNFSAAETTNPPQVVARPSQTVYQGSLQETLVRVSNSAPENFDESNHKQNLEKTSASGDLNSAQKTPSFNQPKSDAREILVPSPDTTIAENQAENQPNSQPKNNLTCRPVSLAGADGWRVVAGPCLAVEDCEMELDREMVIATNRYIAEVLGRDDVESHLRIDAGFVKSHLLHKVAQPETIDTSYGKMRYLTAILRFDQAFSDELDTRWKNTQQKARVLQAGLGTGSVLLLLVVILGYLKFDTRTGGRYSGRLKITAVGVILVLVTVAAGISGWILWI